ncbi:hypothetical protein P22_3680 [Propionispora sp. 2/2-37]|uniref:hypothetical protein n=1 Tax=Propionispora sp. 2/2-37 TaxID=1677858 RepID=UPI0006C4A148|nr:hypothetical protein [Propionispora sp. 2/2-37]CUH97549.1 hypothetical protein P22_3680 [Propionispora sp. 2/2-37]
MATATMRRYIFIDGKVKRIGINRDLHMPEKACEKIPEMHIFLDQNGEVFGVQVHYIFLDTEGNVAYEPHGREAAYVFEKKIGPLLNKINTDNIIQLPIRVKSPDKYGKAVQAFADTFVEKKYGTQAEFNILLDHFLEIRG